MPAAATVEWYVNWEDIFWETVMCLFSVYSHSRKEKNVLAIAVHTNSRFMNKLSIYI